MKEPSLDELKRIIKNHTEQWYDEAPCGFLFTDPNGGIIRINKTLINWLGHERSDIEGHKHFIDLLHIGSKIYYETHFAPLLKMQGALTEVTLDLKSKSGKRVPVLINTIEKRDNQGKTLLYASTFFDISDRRSYERELLESRNKNKKLAQRALFLAKASDKLRQSRPITESLQELASLATEQFCDAFVIDTMDKSNIHRLAESNTYKDKVLPSLNLFNNFSSGLLIEDIETKKNIGSMFECLQEMEVSSFMAYPVTIDSNSKAFISCFLFGIGKHFNQEDFLLLQELGKKIEDESEKQSLRIQKEQDLIRKEKLLDELQAEKEIRERFVATLSHDLRSPLYATSLSIELLKQKDLKECEQEDIAERALASLGRIDNMLEGLLDANTLIAGQSLPLNLTKFDMVKSVHKAFSSMSSIHGDRFKLNSPKSVCGQWDEGKILRILENLLSNAIKYGDKEAVVTVQLEQSQSEVILSVHNQGNPIPEKEWDNLFKPYHRAGRDEHKKGWGLGLSLVKGAVEAHKGSISVDSSKAEGTTFKIKLPLC
ncbi:MAG: PAS domain-containing sensor histidine kinase [Bacteriovoracaceae bacterium]|nr:PAS domain-containing sensor histidine kinase [Bacteriovoracaceae bacterium]